MSFQQQPVDPVEISREFDPARAGVEFVRGQRLRVLDGALMSEQAFRAMGTPEEVEQVPEMQSPEADTQSAPITDLDARRLLRQAQDEAQPTADYEVEERRSAA